MAIKKVPIRSEYITLDAFLKFVGVAATGGHAKTLIAEGAVKVNGEPELRRGRKLHPGDRIQLAGAGDWEVTMQAQQEEG